MDKAARGVIESIQLRLRTRWHRFCALISALGVSAAAKYMLRPRDGFILVSKYMIHPRQTLHPLSVRCRSSDIDVFRQIFVDREYGCLDDMPDVGLIIDCGAYVGYSSAYFLSQFPKCQVIAIEPDPDNFAMLRCNMAEYGNRVKSVRAAIWSHKTRLVLSRQLYRDGREWTTQVRPCGSGEKADVEGLDIGSLLACSPYDRISLLKVDVEGAEAVIFAENYDSWLDKVDAIVIELHDDSAFGKASDVFFSAISGRGFQVSQSVEHCTTWFAVRRSTTNFQVCSSLAHGGR